ncbi:lactoylglutathione lyase/glyoxalase I family protein, partial [Trifolium medium]|nr:lactoylglutathione lyase/glyoxalase I family protein [Trifolium medium]
MAGAVGEGVSLNHIAIESSDIKRLTKFYKEMFGFEEVETPNFGDNHFKI